MHYTTMVFSAILIVIGVAGYLGGGDSSAPAAENGAAATENEDGQETTAAESKGKVKRSGTALIPAAFGVVLLICGTLAFKPEWRKHAIHAAVGLAALCSVGILGRLLMKAGPWLSGDPEVNSRAMWFQLAMLITLLVYLGFGIQSFVAARRARHSTDSAD